MINLIKTYYNFTEYQHICIIMDLKNKKVGIWGLGISGSATLRHLITYNCTLQVLNKTEPQGDNAQLLKKHAITCLLDNQKNRTLFLASNDYIIPSPGIDLRPYKNFIDKIIPESDLFQTFWKKPIIGITGSLGKTSITHLLSQVLTNEKISIQTGGNIGTGMLDLIDKKADYALLELSSFQLESCKLFAPDIAIITNFHPNHLDRHGTIEAYLKAKKTIFLHQKNNQITLLPLACAPIFYKNQFPNKPIHWFTEKKPTQQETHYIKASDTLYYFDTHKNIIKNKTTLLLPHNQLPDFSYQQNWLIIVALLDILGLTPRKTINKNLKISLPNNRLEPVAIINDVTYFNDSKATIMQATLKAVKALKNKDIILLLGGTSKGVNREESIQQLFHDVKKIICFGKEADQLMQICSKINITATSHHTLESALQEAHEQALPGSVVLLSPGGASFDLFSSYEERGEHFKKLVKKLIPKN